MVGLALSLLGSFQATLDGNTIAGFESDRVRALLAYLAVESDRPHRRETLTGLLWPDWPDSSALTNLRNSLANLRKAIGDREAAIPILSINRENLQFTSTEGNWVDIQSFRILTAPGQTIERLEEGIVLYRGPFLEGFGLKDSPPFEEWQQRERDQLQRQCLAALERVSEHYEQSGNMDKALGVTLRQVDLAPWQEEAHRRLMRLLALNGQRSAALAQYETCRHLLQKELGVEVSAETTLLYQRILNGEIAALAETPGLSKATTLLFTSPDLPTWQIPFVGRRALTEEIRKRLLDPDCRLLTLLGAGGSGKTRLAAETAARQAPAFPDGVCFALLAGPQPGVSIVPSVAQALGFKFRENEDPQLQVLNYLRNKALLLVLDNFEHLSTQAAVVAEILRAAPRVKILVTSQVRLNLSGEHLVQVSGMEVPAQPPASLAEALQHSSLQLFVEGARRVVPTFEPTLADLEQILRICRLVQGMPLAILLAAGWMHLLTPAEIAAEIESHSLDFLESEWRDVPERQRSLRAVFDYSWRLLSEREREVFAGLTVFRGDFSYPAAQQVSGAVLRDLMKLVNHSLLERTTVGHYQLHELVRQYGEEKLNGFPDLGNSIRDRFAAFYTSGLKTWARQLKSPSQMEALAEMDLEFDNIRTAWSWAIERHQIERLAEGWEGLVIFYFWRGHLAEGGLLFQQAADLLEADELTLQPIWLELLAVLLAIKFHFTRPWNQDKRRERFYQSMNLLEMAAKSGQDVRRYKAYVMWITSRIGGTGGNLYDEDVEETKRIIIASESLFQELNDHWGEAQALKTLAEIDQFIGDHIEAVLCFEKSLAISRGLGVQMEAIETQRDLSFVLTHTGRLEEAEQLLRECISFYRRLGDQMGLAKGLYILLTNLMIGGRYRDVSGLLEECNSIEEKFGDHVELAKILMRKGQEKLGLGDYDQARLALQKSYSLFQETGTIWGMGSVKWHFGELALSKGQWGEAYQYLQESIALFHSVGAQGMISRPLAALGIAELKLNDLSHVHQRMTEVLLYGKEFHDYVTAIYILPCAFLLLAEEGKVERAMELYAAASQNPFFTNSVFIQDQVGKTIATISGMLPPEIATAAKERGRQRDLWATMDELLAEFGGS